MKKIKMVFVVGFVLALGTAFINKKQGDPVNYGWAKTWLSPNQCQYMSLDDFGFYSCSTEWYGPVCTILNNPAYGSPVGCGMSFPLDLLRKEFE